MATFECRRQRALIDAHISRAGLHLSGLTVFTEIATGPYLLTPFIAALAGAERVFAVTRDSRWGTAADVEKLGRERMAAWGLGTRIEVLFDKVPGPLGKSDIVTNLGFVRPLDEETLTAMKPSAVIPLMWETWEFRPDELDIDACRKKGVLVMGTDEHRLDDFIAYAAFVDLKLLFEAGIEAYRSRLLVFASNPVARVLHDVFGRLGLDYRLCSLDEASDPRHADREIPPDDPDRLYDWCARADAVLCDEKAHERLLIGCGGVLDPDELAAANDALTIVCRSGVIDHDLLEAAGCRVYPQRRVPFGHSTVGSYHLGPRPVIELHAAGLKVGEVMARARIAGYSVEEAARIALRDSPAMDFPGRLSWTGNEERRSSP